MKRKKIQSIVLLLAAVSTVLFSACKSDVNFSDIDKHAEIGLDLALPIASMSASINDFIGNDSVAKYIVVNEDGVLQFNYDYDMIRPYTTIVLTDYMSEASTGVKVYDQTGAVINGTGNPLPAITLPITLEMHDCNVPTSIPEHGRIDSMYISNAQFTTTLQLASWAVPKEYVSSVRLVMGDQFRREGGKTQTLAFEDFGKPMTIEVEDFYINLLKNKSLKPSTKAEGDANVLNTMDMSIELVLNVPSGTPLPVVPTSQVIVSTRCDIMEYNALWGYFIPGNKMREEGTEDIASDFKEWAKIKKCTLMLAKPRVDLVAETEFVAPLNVNVNEMSVTSKESNITEKATFSGSTTTVWHFITPQVYQNQWGTPLGTIYSDVYHMTEDPAKGDLARLFRLRPDSLNYSFNIDVDPDNMHLQHRMNTNPNIYLYTKLRIPLSFNKGMELSYTDTIDDINISLNLDSIIESTKVIDSIQTSDIKVRLRAESTIPLDVKAGFCFLDSLNQKVDFDDLIDNDTIIIKAPTELKMGVVDPNHPGVSELIFNVSKDEVDKLADVKKIVYDAYILTSNETFDQNPDAKYVSLLPSSGLKLHLGASANLEVLLDLDFNKEENK